MTEAEDILARIEGLLPKDAEGNFLAFKDGPKWKFDPHTKTGEGECPEKSDVVHDFLAYLAGQMIEMNKRKQAETKRFLDWLRAEIGREIDDLRLKTKIRDYHAGDFDDLLKALKANDRVLNRIAHRSEFQADLRREFDASLAVLAPLKARIAATDWLIDQIVYHLYGLTEEEVAIVESRAADHVPPTEQASSLAHPATHWARGP